MSLLPRLRVHLRAASAFVMAGCAVLALLEIGLRALTFFGYSTFVFRRHDPQLGTTLIPAATGPHQRCFDGFVDVNAHGMRDRERRLRGSPNSFRIGVFGDSIMEAVHVQSEETASLLLEKRLNEEVCDGGCEVLNFSVAGFSTVQQFLRYEQLGRRFDLDLVLVVTIPNDLVANLDPADVIAGSVYDAPHLVPRADGFGIEPPRPLALGTRTVSLLARHSAAALYATKVYYKLLLPLLNGDGSADRATVAAGQPDLGSEQWEAFSHVLARFREAVEANGAGFAVAYIAEEDGHWTRPGTARIWPHAGRAEMQRRFGDLRREGFLVHDLGADITAYARSKKLEWPYLSFVCDSHYNPVGQRVIADGLFDFLNGTDLL